MRSYPFNKKIYLELFNDFPGLLALLDEKGNIIATNKTWMKEALKRGLIARADGVGYNYLQLCEKVEGDEKIVADKVKEGILAILKGQRKNFSLIYSFLDLEEKKEKKFLLILYELQLKPKILVMLHIELPIDEILVKLEKERETAINFYPWHYFIEGVLLPFLHILKGKLPEEIEPLRVEIFNKIEALKEAHLKSLHPLALLTTKEAQIALLVKEGKTSEEIARLLNLSKHAVDFYRKRIREKLELKGKNLSLERYLKELLKGES